MAGPSGLFRLSFGNPRADGPGWRNDWPVGPDCFVSNVSFRGIGRAKLLLSRAGSKTASNPSSGGSASWLDGSRVGVGEAVVGRFCHRRGSAGASPSRAGVPRSRVSRRAARSFIRGLTPPARLALCEERALSTRWGNALRELVFRSHRHALLFLQRPRGDRCDCNVVVERALRKRGGRRGRFRCSPGTRLRDGSAP
ncbi:hypothetical protein VT03_22455 [Planctomyces sp. SH-PL14]|nr:hypothetical protein VT03_22455 [Planctomyces sp. SH-PL14]